jgi:5-formyltetrahydrofolate cyclo-ligase
MDSVALKKALRKELLARRAPLTEEWIRAASGDMFIKWRNRFSMRQVAWIHVFQSIAEAKEVDTTPFMQYLRVKHSRVNIVVPVVDVAHDMLRHVHVGEDVELVKNRWGIPEPKMPVEYVQPMMIDMVLVPLLGFDMQGNRIGYGKGYYDRFMQLLRPKCLKVGLAFELSKVEEGIPAEPHDVPLDFVVTEQHVHRLNENLNF